MRGMNYGSFTGRYGEAVSLTGSSSATEAQAWLNIDSAANKNDGQGGERIKTEALLTIPLAKMLIAALENFIYQESPEEDE